MFESYLTDTQLCEHFAKYKVGDKVTLIVDKSITTGIAHKGTLLEIKKIKLKIKDSSQMPQIPQSQVHDYYVDYSDDVFDYECVLDTCQEEHILVCKESEIVCVHENESLESVIAEQDKNQKYDTLKRLGVTTIQAIIYTFIFMSPISIIMFVFDETTFRDIYGHILFLAAISFVVFSFLFMACMREQFTGGFCKRKKKKKQ